MYCVSLELVQNYEPKIILIKILLSEKIYFLFHVIFYYKFFDTLLDLKIDLVY